MPERWIQVRGARQHCLKSLDVDIPLHQLTVVTGLSGSGKSSLAFDTLYAEGQRRYVETFSPYTRQFLERMDKPDVDRIDHIPPAIAIEQANPVKTSRSTVGTMTEIADYLKLLFARLGRFLDPATGREIRPHTTSEIAARACEAFQDRDVYVAFAVPFAKRPSLASALAALRQQGFLRVLIDRQMARTDDPVPAGRKAPEEIIVLQDRIRLTAANRARLAEAVEQALRHGRGVVRILPVEELGDSSQGAPSSAELRFSDSWTDPFTGVTAKEPTPNLFSFNNPVGACPTCRGFGRVIEIDYHRALPDRNLAIAQGVVKPWQSGISAECQKDLLKHCKRRGIPVDVPFHRLKPEHQRFVIEGELADGRSLNELWEAGGWYGVRGFFEWLETKTYKMHVRVFLARYRAYRRCSACQGARFQPETLRYKVASAMSGAEAPALLSIAEVSRLSLRDAHAFLSGLEIPAADEAARQVQKEVLARLGYLLDVGLGYLTLDRATRTLSGGEVERVNLTSCLGNSLVNTLFVLDEPSIGLHPRDTRQLLGVIRRLRDRGNTLVLVEHEEAVMRAADHVIDLGPGRGEAGGEIVYAGPFAGLPGHPGSLTAAYLAGRSTIPLPDRRRSPDPGRAIRFRGASAHNIRNLDIDVPLGLLVAVTGVSGSGKSTFVHDVLYTHLLKSLNKSDADVSDDSTVDRIEGAQHVADVIRVDQAPLTKTPRSNPALYLGIFESIRKLFASSEEAVSQGLTAGDFSFNGGQGRCPRCNGMGAERIEMQFLADVFVTCPSCEGRRYQPHVLKVRYQGVSIDEVLGFTATKAIAFFDAIPPEASAGDRGHHQKIVAALRLLDEVGLGYLKLGQPLNQLSGGEAQRVKLLGYLHEGLAGARAAEDGDSEDPDGAEESSARRPGTRLLILDEPTTGLHFEDIRLLLQMLQRLVGQGDSLIVIEHNLDVIKCADWILDLGPEAGDGGGRLVAAGSPEMIAAHPSSHTGAFLREKLSGRPSHVAEEPAAYRTAKTKSKAKLLKDVAGRLGPGRIEIRGARHHNLKNLSLDIDLERMTVVTGLSGSGKSTLAFDLLFAEGQRRYLDSLNAYARQFVEQLEKPDVDLVAGIPPAVAIEQRLTQGGRKSTVGTVTEIHQFLRLLFAKLGQAHDPETGEPAVRRTAEDIVRHIEKARGRGELTLLAPLVRGRKGFHTEVAKWALKNGYPALRVDGKWIEPSKFKALDRYSEHTIDLVLGNLDSRQTEAARRRLIETALSRGRGTVYTLDNHRRETIYSTHLYCPGSGRSFDELEPRLFSYNSPHGWCPQCQGYGFVTAVNGGSLDREDFASELEREVAADRACEAAEDSEAVVCSACGGSRLNAVARAVRLPVAAGARARRKGGPAFPRDPSLPDIGKLTVVGALEFFQSLAFAGREGRIARDILPEILQRLRFLREVGLGYLSLDRAATTLSGGESQRIRLAAQLGSNLQGVLYVLDEPTIGLHPRDNARLLHSLRSLRDKGNTLVVVEHDEDTMRAADDIIDLGPGAGTHGGRVVARGNWKSLARSRESVTGQILGDPIPHPMRGARRPVGRGTPWARVYDCHANNLRRLDVRLPLGRFTAVCGPSGAGKSTLVHDVLKAALAPSGRKLKKRRGAPKQPWGGVETDRPLTAIYEVDQSPIGKTSRSTPATYIGIMDDLRALFAQIPLARQRGYTPSRFSFNSGDGRCEKCLGQGAIKVEMNFLPPTWIPCEDCRGRRYKPETLEVHYAEKSIADVLDMTIEEAAAFFADVPRLQRPLQLLDETGLGYLTLGQRSPTLSGGEAQRIKLVAELSRSLGINARQALRDPSALQAHHLYLLEEPTIGLHLADVRRLLEVLHRLVDAGHTVVVIEHHLDVIAEADHVLELGPDGGEGGGRLVASGTPEEIARASGSPTAPYLRPVLKRKPKRR